LFLGEFFMFSFLRCLSKKAALFSLGLTFATISPLALTVAVSAQETPPVTTPSPTTTSFTDVSSDYWASPFIQALAQRNIIAGFGDSTFKPEQAVTRAEFAAMIQKAFNQNSVRQLPQGGFSDVPANYWAAAAIQEAYETGFMSGYPQNRFQPNQRIIKVDAIVSLGSGLGLTGGDINSLSTYFTDANAIPSYATDKVAAATTANLIVNYPELKVLNPATPLTRAEAAAHLYQALVKLGQVQPLASNIPAANYIVAGTPSQDTGSTPTPTPTNSFNTLTSLIQAAGLESTLQQGEYTIFAPTDAAFAALPPETLQRLQQPENKATLARILQYHIVSGQLTASQLKTGELRTVEKKAINVQVNSNDNKITVNNAQVIQADIQANNGVIHAINQVLIPPDVSLDGQNTVKPGRATRGGRSYLGVAGNIGLSGDTGLGESSFAVISKIGLTNRISVRPSAVIGDNTVVLVPLTFDFVPQSANPTGERTFSISPYLGAGVAIETSDDADIGLLLTGGIDVPLGNRFTVTGAVNAAFLGSTDVGLVLGVGFNF
jgi:uncharacterized surface protein with fasciclin (FAS1) repeats